MIWLLLFIAIICSSDALEDFSISTAQPKRFCVDALSVNLFNKILNVTEYSRRDFDMCFCSDQL